MPRSATTRASAAIALLLAAACGDTSAPVAPAATNATTAPNADVSASLFGGDRGWHGSSPDALIAANPLTLAEVLNPVTGAKVTVFNGGYGSAMAAVPGRRDAYYLMTDRGPNFAFKDGLAFPVPTFTPEIGVFQRRSGKLIRTATIPLKNGRCKPLSGLPLPAGTGGSTGEIAYALDGSLLTPDPEGIDSEGLVVMDDGTFWVSDEYGPFLAHFNRSGCQLERISPFSGGRALPKVLAKRRANRGMEGLTAILGGRVLVGMMQSPLDNPQAAGRASRLARVVVFDTRTGKSRQYAYLLESASLANSEILSLGLRRFLVLERDGDFPGNNPAAVKRLYEIDLRGATDISDPANGEKGLLVNGKTLEELTANAADPAAVLRAAGIEPVKKEMEVDILAKFPGYQHDKVEGLALIDPFTVAISNDDDFAVAEGPGGLVQKILPGTAPAQPDFNEVIFIRLKRPFGLDKDDARWPW